MMDDSILYKCFIASVISQRWSRDVVGVCVCVCVCSYTAHMQHAYLMKQTKDLSRRK